MLDQVAILLILFVLWIGLRYWGARWLWLRAHEGRISFRSAQLIHAGFYFLLPLIGLPWARSGTDVAILVAAGVALFVFQLALARGYRRFLDRNA
jgi:hypothetical protein